MFFESWYPIYRILVVGVLAYIFLVASVRLGGKRTLAQMNTFDFVVNVALGSAFATLILSKDTVLAEGVAAILLLIGLQSGVTWVTAHFPQFRQAVDAEPSLLVRHGQPLKKTMKRQRVGMADVLAAIRSNGNTDIAEVDFVILETDGSLSVIKNGNIHDSAMKDVARSGGEGA